MDMVVYRHRGIDMPNVGFLCHSNSPALASLYKAYCI